MKENSSIEWKSTHLFKKQPSSIKKEAGGSENRSLQLRATSLVVVTSRDLPARAALV